MNGKNIKLIRAQIKNVVQGLLPNLLQEELAVKITKDINVLVDDRLNKLAEAVQSKMEEINERSKDVQTYILRQTAQGAPTPEATPEVAPPAVIE